MDGKAHPPIVADNSVRCWRCMKLWLMRVGPGTEWRCPCGAVNEA